MISRPVRRLLRALVLLYPPSHRREHGDEMLLLMEERWTRAHARGGRWAFAVFLALMGAYGLVSFRTSSARREIGLRLALGADRSEVYRLAAGLGLFLGGIGVVGGVPLALLAGRFLQGQLFGIGGADPLSLAIGTGLVLLTAVVPARRTLRLDPATVFREE